MNVLDRACYGLRMAQRVQFTPDEVSALRAAQIAVAEAKGEPRQTVLDRQAELHALQSELLEARRHRDEAYVKRGQLWLDIAEQYPGHSRLAVARAIAYYAKIDPSAVFRRLPVREGEHLSSHPPQLSPDEQEALVVAQAQISQWVARVQVLRNTKPAAPRRITGHRGKRSRQTGDKIDQAERARNELIRLIDARYGGGHTYGVAVALAAATGLHRTMIHKILARGGYGRDARPGLEA